MITIQLLTRRYSEGTAPKRGGINESHEDEKLKREELGEDRIDRFPPTESFTAVVIESLLTERQVASQQEE